MRILLMAVNAKYIHSNPAIYSLQRYAVNCNQELAHCIELAEYTINNSMDNILADMYRRKPDVIAISCYIWNWTMVKEIIRESHKILPDAFIWVGGPEVTYNPEEVLEDNEDLTGVMIGEGEVTFYELSELYVGMENRKLSEIKGLCIRTDNGIVRTEHRPLTDISTIPFLYSSLDDFRNRIIYYESSRGCPFLCSYCLSSIDKTVRFRDLEVVKRELQFFLDNKVAQVKFVDRTFNCNHEHAMEIWRYIREHDNGITNFHFEIEADLITEEELELLRTLRPGSVQMEIGVQSTNENTLRHIRRYAGIDRIRAVVKELKKANNIHLHLDLIAGLPYEDLESFRHSFNDVYAMEPEQLQLGFLKVLKGSHMAKMAEEYGLVYKGVPPYEVLYTKWLSYDDILMLKKIEEMVEIYYNSNQFGHVLPQLLKEFEDPFSMFFHLAEFYERKGYFVNTPSRTYRYKVILDFVDEIVSPPQSEALRRDEVVFDKREMFVELLIFDLYAREKLKSRPDFMNEVVSPPQSKALRRDEVVSPPQSKALRRDEVVSPPQSLALRRDEVVNRYGIIRQFYDNEKNIIEYFPDYQEYSPKQIMKMTHAEVFHYTVWEENVRITEPVLVLFDYRKRNAITGEAYTQIFKL